MALPDGSTSSIPHMADAPFNHPSADIVFRTSDEVQFHLFKGILMVSSPFFNDMFSLPRAPDATTQDPVRISEDSVTFDRLLRLCYPVAPPAFEDLQLLGRVLEASMKYNMEEVARRARAHLDPFRQTDPLEVFVIACRLQLEEEARKAADVWKATVTFTQGDKFETTVAGAAYVPSMVRIPAGVYFRLIQHGLGTFPADSSFCDSPTATTVELSAAEPVRSYQTLDLDTSRADVVSRSSDGTEFVVHRVVLELASAGALCRNLDESKATHGGLAVAPVDLPDRVLLPLLELCYPLRGSWAHSEDVHLVCSVVAAAVKLEMPKIVAELRKVLLSLGAKYPVIVYFALVKLGWTEDAWTTAQHSATVDIDNTYTSFMEEVSADIYHALLQYRHQCQHALLQTIRAHVSPHFSNVSDPTWIRYLTNESWGRMAAGKDAHALAHVLLASVERAKEMKNGCPNRGKHGYGAFAWLPQPTLLDVTDYTHRSEEMQSKLETTLAEVSKPKLDAAVAKQGGVA